MNKYLLSVLLLQLYVVAGQSQTSNASATVRWQVPITAWSPTFLPSTYHTNAITKMAGGVLFYWEKSPTCDKNGNVTGHPKVLIYNADPGITIENVWVFVRGIRCDGRVASQLFVVDQIGPYERKSANGNETHNFKEIKEVVSCSFLYKIGDAHYSVRYNQDDGTNKFTINNKTISEYEDWVKDQQQAAAKLKEEAAKKEEEKREQVQKEQKEKEAKERIEKDKKEKADKEKKQTTNSKSDKDTSESKSSDASSNSTYVTEHDIQMRLRAEAQAQKDAAEDKIMTAAITGTAAAMTYAAMGNLDNNDEDDELSMYLKGTMGLGLQQTPVISNTTYGNYNYSSGSTYSNVSQKGSTNNYYISACLLFAALNDKFISVRLSPFFTYGMNAFDNGTSGSHITYGSGAALGLGRKFKILLKGEYVSRSGNMTTDGAGSFVDVTEYTNYKYNTIKYGAAAYLGFGGHDSFAELSIYKENLSFLKTTQTSVYSYEAKISFALMAIAIQYAPNYPIAGELKYPGTFKKEKANLLSLSLYVPFKIFSID